MAFHPYLMFGGNCRQAFTRYQEVFGGELTLLTGADLPEGEEGPTDPNVIMHAALTFGDNLLMASDDPTGGFAGVQGMHVHYSAPDEGEAKRVFEALADGGQVTMPLAKTFWSPMFGMCTDRFGTPWMIDTEQPEQTS